MPGISSDLICHRLAIHKEAKPVAQRRCKIRGERPSSIKTRKLLDANFIREIVYTTWLANVVLVKKNSGKWRMCVDYTNLNKACPKDTYSENSNSSAYNCTPQSTTQETPYRLTYGYDAMIPVVVEEASHRRLTFNNDQNNQELAANLDMIDEIKDEARVKEEACKLQAARRYNTKVKPRKFRPGDLVLRL
uniref:Transposon Ty3-I Gag-Pol polyprotein n=1 Tax=Cajanus cajan TaxID=3821 RepID=A0A151SF82_CAJCA|nr:hypothetical protein KK1_024629 [Cajanus cajan]